MWYEQVIHYISLAFNCQSHFYFPWLTPNFCPLLISKYYTMWRHHQAECQPVSSEILKSHHFMVNRRGKSRSSDRFSFPGPQITADGDCIHEIRRHLLLGSKVMRNLDSILKNRDITLLTKVCMVNAMVFPVVTYGCESWTIKKAEHRKTDGFKDSSESLGLIKPVNPKGKSIMNIHWRNWC